MPVFCSECNNVVTDTYKEWVEHIISDSHQNIIAEKVWTWPDEINQRSVVITQKPNEKEDFENLDTSFFTIIWYFTKYGTISNAFKHPSKKFCIIQFEKVEEVQTVLTTEPVVFDGTHVVLRLKSALSPEDWFKLCSASELQEVTLGSGFHSKHIWLTEQIQDDGPDVQLDKLLRLLTMSEYDFKKREQVRNELMSIVREQYPNAKLIGIGDVITGLGDSDSVLKLSFELPGASYMDSLMENVNRLMMSSVVYFKEVNFVKGYPAPYINATHCTTDVKVQLWFNNSVRVHSSKLIQFLISLDPRVLPLMILIRYWASYNFQPPNLMDTYTLDLLVMVYLNCMKILPNVAFLQLKSSMKTPLLDEFWNVNFCTDYANISEILASSRQWDVEYTSDGKPTAGSVLFLAKHFFRMYAKVDFRITFVCSLLGSFFLKRHLDVDCKNITLPELLQPYTNWSHQQKKEERFKFDSAMCVQDPFNLSLNTAADVTEVAVLTFQNACYNSVDIFDKMLEDPSESGSILNVTNVIDFVVPREENNSVDYERNVQETNPGTLRQSMMISSSPSTSNMSNIVSSQSEIPNYSNIPGSDNFNINPLAPLVVTIGNHGDVDYRTHFNRQSNLQPLMAMTTTTGYFSPQNNDLGFNMQYNVPTNFIPIPHSTIQDVPNPLNIMTGIPHTSPTYMTNNWINQPAVTSYPGTTNDRWFPNWPPVNEAYPSSKIPDFSNADDLSSGMTVSVTRTVTEDHNKQNKPGSKKKMRMTPIRKVKVTRTISVTPKSPQGNRNRGKKVPHRAIGRAVAYMNSKSSRFVSNNRKQ